MRPKGEMRTCRPDDAAALCELYNPYVHDTVVTFEETPVSSADMAQRIAEVTDRFPWLVWEQEGRVVGFAYGSAWRARSAYRQSAETTVYLAASVVRQGIGRALYSELIARLRALGMHCAIGGIALPNAASVALHESLGYHKVAHFSEVGFKLGRWVDVAYWQLML